MGEKCRIRTSERLNPQEGKWSVQPSRGCFISEGLYCF